MTIYSCCVFFKQKTAYEMRISDWSSDVCSSDLPPGVEHTDRRNRFESLVGFRCGQRVPTAAADTKQAQTRGIDTRVLSDEVRHAVDVLDAVCRLVYAARRAATAALKCRIRGDGDIAQFSQVLGVQARDLFFYAAIRRSE